MRVLGLDVGSKTIGIAVTDELGVAAHTVTTLTRRGTLADVAQIETLAQRYETRCLVVGLPYEPDGREGQRAKRVRILIDALAAANFQVELCDESFSTSEAEEHLISMSASRKKRKDVIDQLAAQVILTRWLEGRHQ